MSEPDSPAPTASRLGQKGCLYVILAIAFCVLAARWLLVAEAGSPVPHFDQWDVEGNHLYGHARAGTLTWERLSGAHMEHRPLLANLWNVAVFRGVGGWDPLTQMVLNAVFPACGAAWMAALLLPCRPERGWHLQVIACVLVVWAFPWGYQNTLWGFQSQFLLLVLLSLIAITGLLGSSQRQLVWWVALAAGVAAPWAMGAGALAGGAVASVAALRWWAARSSERTRWAILVAIGLALTLWGLHVHVANPAAEFLRVRSFDRWLLATATGLAWPWHQAWWWAVGCFAPVAWWAFAVVTRRLPPSAPASVLAGVCVWSVLSMMAMAYVRGGAAIASLIPVSRYLDTVVPGVMASGLLWNWLPGRPARLAGGIWIAVVGAGVVWAGTGFFRETLPALRSQKAVVLDAANSELQTGKSGVHLHVTGSHPSAETIRTVLSRGSSEGWLPSELTMPAPELWALSGTLGGIVEASDGEAGPIWRSPPFAVTSKGLMLLMRGAAAPVLESNGGGEAVRLQRLVDAGGGWMRWGRLTEPGLYTLRLERDGSSSSPVELLWPRPLSSVAYATRRLLAFAPEVLVFSLVLLLAAVYSAYFARGPERA